MFFADRIFLATCHILSGHKESTSLFEAAVGLWHVEELSGEGSHWPSRGADEREEKGAVEEVVKREKGGCRRRCAGKGGCSRRVAEGWLAEEDTEKSMGWTTVGGALGLSWGAFWLSGEAFWLLGGAFWLLGRSFFPLPRVSEGEREAFLSWGSKLRRRDSEFLTTERDIWGELLYLRSLWRDKLIERAETWFLFAWGTRYVRSFLLVSHYSSIFHNIMLFWVDVEGHWSVCWYVCLHACRFVHLLIWYAPVVVMKCLRIMRVVAFDMVYPPARKIHGWFMKWIFWYFPLFIHLLSRSVSFTSPVSWYPSMVRIHFLIPAQKRS